MPIKFVGDLSTSDAHILARVGADKYVLEFGSGGSTQIFAQVAKSVVSVETDEAWIARTQDNLGLLDSPAEVAFMPFEAMRYDQPYDVIFVDGVPDKRLQFALAAWPCLTKGGVMLFHDTRRSEYMREVAWLMQVHFAEVSSVVINEADSNLTLLHKRHAPLHYVNWNDVEGKPAWAYGKAERPYGADLWPLPDRA